MSTLDTMTARLTRLLGYIGVFAIFIMMLHIVTDVVLRSTINTGVPATEELVTRYYMVTLALLPLAWVEWNKEMISVEVFSSLLHGRIGWLLSLASNLLCLAVYCVFAYTSWLKAIDQYQIGSYVMSLNVPMPVWPTYFVVPIAFAVAAVVILLRIAGELIHSGGTARHGN